MMEARQQGRQLGGNFRGPLYGLKATAATEHSPGPLCWCRELCHPALTCN
jgi:hypothetical protein